MRDRWVVLYLHAVVAAAAFASGWYVYSQAPALPLVDEWGLLHEWTQSPSTLEWAWQHHNEHRFPITKLLWLAILKTTDFRFNAPQFATLAFLTSAAILSLWTARTLRGRAHPVDVVFPALLLHFGHGTNWLMGYQLGFASAVYAVVGWLWCAARLSSGGGPVWVYLSVLYTALILGCGGFGIAFTPPIVVWLAFLARRSAKQNRPVAATALTLAAVGSITYTGVVIATMPILLPGGFHPSEQPWDFAAVVFEFLACALGTWSRQGSTTPHLLRGVCGAVVLLYCIGTPLLLRRLWRERSNAAGPLALSLVVFGAIIVAAATARARPGGMLDRYILLSACGFIALSLSFIRPSLRAPNRLGIWLWGGFALVAAIALFHLNRKPGMAEAYTYRDANHPLQLDLASGEPVLYLSGRHGGSINVWRGDAFAATLANLRRAGIRPFDRIRPDPEFIIEPLHEFSQTRTWRDAEFELPDPPPGAIALRFVGRSTEHNGRAKVELYWIDAETARSHSDTIHPWHVPHAMHHSFKLTGRPTKLRVRAGTPLAGFQLEAFEWLIGEPAR